MDAAAEWDTTAMTDLAAECRRAIALIDTALTEPPAAVTADADEALRVLVRVRDTLISERRRGDRGRAGSLLRVNGVLSLLAGVEYPAGGLHRSSLSRARDALGEIVDGGWFAAAR
jgi:hypothetical protein